MIRATILCFFLSIPAIWSQVDGVSEDQLGKESLYIDAVGHALVEEYEEAIEKMRKFSSQEPTDFAPYFYLAKWSWQADNLIEGISQVNRAETLAPENRDVLELKLTLLKENFQMDAAAETAQKIWALDSTSVQAALRPAHLYLEASNLNDADKWLTHVYQVIPIQNGARADILELHLDVLLSGQDFEKAEKRAKLLLEIAPKHLPYLYRLAKVYQAQQDIEKELEVLRKVNLYHPEAWEAKKRLVHLESNGNLEAYLEGITPILKSNDVSISDKIDLLTSGLSYYFVTARKDREALFSAAQSLYRNEPESTEAQSLYIEAAGYNGQWGEAVDRILYFAQDSRSQLELDEILRYMSILIQAQRYSTVVEWGEDLLLRYPNNGELHLNLAYAYLQLNDKQEADYFLSSGSRMIRANDYLQKKAAVMRYLIEPKDTSNEDLFWFKKSVETGDAEKIELPTLLFALKHEEVSFSEDWLQYITSKSGGEDNPYLLNLTQAWAFFHLGDLKRADERVSDSWNEGGYTQPESYVLRYKIAVKQGKTEKAKEIQTELENRGVSWKQ